MTSPVNTLSADSVKTATGGLFKTVLLEVKVEVAPSLSTTVKVTL